ncbi:MAG: hypothetical protein ACLPQS_03910 [Acidimicrobiales bacterium]
MSAREQSAVDFSEESPAPSLKPVLLLFVLLVASAVGAVTTTSNPATRAAPSSAARPTLVAATSDLGWPSQSSLTWGHGSVRVMVRLRPGKGRNHE